MKRFTLGLAAAAAMAGSGAVASTLIDDTTPGLYNAGIGTSLDGTSFLFPTPTGGDPTINSAPEPDLSPASAALGSWLTSPASPGGTWSAAPQSIPSTWTVNHETAIIYELDGGSTGLRDVKLDIGVDNGVFVWLDGGYLDGQLRPGGASLGEFSLNIGSLSAGTHYLQVLREDHGGSTGWSIDVTGTVAPVPLPAGGILLLTALGGLGGAGALRRRRKDG